MVWGIVAAVLPWWARSASGMRWQEGLRSAVKIVAFAGLAGVAVLLLASAAEGMDCQSCGLTYLLSAVYGWIVFRHLPRGSGPALRGAGLAAGAVAAAYLLLLYPGLRTPKSPGKVFAEAVPAVPPSVEAFLGSLPPEDRQWVADSLRIYRESPVESYQEPRSLALGSPGAAVRITDADALCSHCADLHHTLGELHSSLPPGSFNVDARQFPLDGNCNPHLEVRGPESVRCLAARAQICLEGPRGYEFSVSFYRNQRKLDPELVYRLAAPFRSREERARCVASPDTAARLRDDIDYAWQFRPRGTPLVLINEFRPRGTPLVLINGRQGTYFGPFLYAIMLAGGDADHPAFRALPPPNPNPFAG